VLKSVELIMREVANLKRIGEEYSKQDAGTLSIATTHTQARYFLPEPVAALRKRYPKVQVVLHQGTPAQVSRMLQDDLAEIGLATESLADADGLVSLPCYEWQHVIVVPAAHPLANVERPTLEQIAAEPLVTYHPTFTGRTRIDAAFARARLKPAVALEAIDSDVIKTYVRLGMGVGIVASVAYEPDADSDLVMVDASHLFPIHTTWVGFRRGTLLRNYAYDFMQLFGPHLNRRLIDHAVEARDMEGKAELMAKLQLPIR